MANKKIIAHELGHAICGYILDNAFHPIELELETDDPTARAYCHFSELEEKGNTSIKSLTKLENISDLGGLFGELILDGSWAPWGSSYDMDDFIITNIKSKSALITELFDWMWNDGDELGYCQVIRREKTIKGKRDTTLDVYDTMDRLPNLWAVYMDFLWKIDRKEFNEVVDEISKGKKKNIKGAELKKYILRIVGD